MPVVSPDAVKPVVISVRIALEEKSSGWRSTKETSA